MPKLVSALVRAQIALLKPVIERMNLKSLRKLQDALGKLGTKALAGDVCYIDEFFEGIRGRLGAPGGARTRQGDFVPAWRLVYGRDAQLREGLRGGFSPSKPGARCSA